MLKALPSKTHMALVKLE